MSSVKGYIKIHIFIKELPITYMDQIRYYNMIIIKLTDN